MAKLRQGELFGLTVDRLDLLRRELRVDRQLWTPARGRPFLKPKVAERLGHDLKTLLQTYSHCMPNDDSRVRNIVDATSADRLRSG